MFKKVHAPAFRYRLKAGPAWPPELLDKDVKALVSWGSAGGLVPGPTGRYDPSEKRHRSQSGSITLPILNGMNACGNDWKPISIFIPSPWQKVPTVLTNPNRRRPSSRDGRYRGRYGECCRSRGGSRGRSSVRGHPRHRRFGWTRRFPRAF